MAKFYITTPIYYVNDKPHIGHAFTTVAADILARWHRLSGDEVFFLTGTDEHGEKNQKAADAKGKTPQAFVDELAVVYKEVWKRLGISYDAFQRTSSAMHEAAVVEFVRRMEQSGDVYKGEYEGWYCTPDETFFTELQLVDGKCPSCGREVKRIKEESYFFRLSKYQERLLQYYSENPGFLSPAFRADEIKNRVKAGLKDLSITRTAVKWAIPFPSDSSHTIYVWVDALISYLSGIGWPSGTSDSGTDARAFWPANVHLVGKEINWFHTVIWPAMLFSAGMAPPKKVFAHGWWTVDGKKMSKSVGNVVDPVEMSNKYGADAFRYFLVREKPLGEDGDFSEHALVVRINGELASDLGNFVSRVVTLASRFDGRIEGVAELDVHLDLEKISTMMESQELSGTLEEIWAFLKHANKYVNDKAPWNLSGAELAKVLYNLVEATRVISILISPFMPETSERINAQLGIGPGTLSDCVFSEFSGRVSKGEHLFNRVV